MGAYIKESPWAHMLIDHFSLKAFSDVYEKLFLKRHLHLVYSLVVDVIHLLPQASVGLVEVDSPGDLPVNFLPFRSHPCWMVDPVCNVADIQFLLEVTGPQLVKETGYLSREVCLHH